MYYWLVVHPSPILLFPSIYPGTKMLGFIFLFAPCTIINTQCVELHRILLNSSVSSYLQFPITPTFRFSHFSCPSFSWCWNESLWSYSRYTLLYSPFYLFPSTPIIYWRSSFWVPTYHAPLVTPSRSPLPSPFPLFIKGLPGSLCVMIWQQMVGRDHAV